MYLEFPPLFYVAFVILCGVVLVICVYVGSAEPDAPGVMPRYRHVKTGGTYEVLHQGVWEPTWDPVVVYRSEKHGTIVVRSREEFYDGRFVRIQDGVSHDANY